MAPKGRLLLTDGHPWRTPDVVESEVIVFTANQPNAEGVVTELLLQPLPSANRKPSPRQYRSQAFFDFTEGSLMHSIPINPGAYACAYRFVKSSTGQETELVPCGTLVLPQ